MSTSPSTIAFTLNGQPVLLSDMLRSCKVSGLLDEMLDRVIENRLIEEAARQESVALNDDEFQQAADTYRRSQGLHKAADTEAWLRRHRMSVEDLEARVAAPLLRRKLAEHLTRGQIERFFAENSGSFDRASLSQLIVEREGIASELLSQIVEDGADFAVLARKYSLDEGTRLAGGFLGVVPRQKMPPAVEAAVFGAKAGGVVGPFPTARGFSLIKVEEIIPAQLDAATREAIQKRLFNEWLTQRKKQARVDWTLLDQF